MKGDFGFYELVRHVSDEAGSAPAEKVEAATQFISSLSLVVWTILMPVFYQGQTS